MTNTILYTRAKKSILVIIALLLLAINACTSSFGVVSWDREVHRMYYDKKQLSTLDIDDNIGRNK